MAPKNQKAAKSPLSVPPDPPKTYSTIAEQLLSEYNQSRPYLHLAETKGLSSLSAHEKQAYALSRFLETGAYKHWTEPVQIEFWKAVAEYHIPVPLPFPRDLGDQRGREVGSYSPVEYQEYLRRVEEIQGFRRKSCGFERLRRRALEEKIEGGDLEGAIEEERNRRKFIARLEGRIMGRYEGDPVWDDVVPIPQVEGEGALAAIAYSDEYAEAISYLRAVMASEEHTPRVLDLTAHIISLNPAHYTVWLYRAQTLFALKSSIPAELEWVNGIALSHQKNYQIWHHRQILIDHLYPSLTSSPSALTDLEATEREFMTLMFDEDAKNYHVWSYRQYLVRKLNLFNAAELASIADLLQTDVRNNSAWSHRFFIVFSDPKISTKDSKATEHDPAIPSSIIDREVAFAQAATYEAPQNQSPWNYLRGVLRKGGRELSSVEGFAREFVNLDVAGVNGEGELVRSSHALDFLADVWSEQGKVEEASRALRLLGERYDRVRKGYWDWRRGQLGGVMEKRGDDVTLGVKELDVKG